MTGVSFTMPPGWKVYSQNKGHTTVYDPTQTQGGGSVIVDSLPAYSFQTLDYVAKQAIREGTIDNVHPQRQPDTTLAGSPAYLVTGSNQTYAVYEITGVLHGGRHIEFEFQYNKADPSAQPTIAAVLASVSLT